MSLVPYPDMKSLPQEAREALDRLLPPQHDAVGRRRVTDILETARAAGRTLLTEFESKEVLAAYAIPTVDTRVYRVAFGERPTVKSSTHGPGPRAALMRDRITESTTMEADSVYA